MEVLPRIDAKRSRWVGHGHRFRPNGVKSSDFPHEEIRTNHSTMEAMKTTKNTCGEVINTNWLVVCCAIPKMFINQPSQFFPNPARKNKVLPSVVPCFQYLPILQTSRVATTGDPETQLECHTPCAPGDAAFRSKGQNSSVGCLTRWVVDLQRVKDTVWNIWNLSWTVTEQYENIGKLWQTVNVSMECHDIPWISMGILRCFRTQKTTLGGWCWLFSPEPVFVVAFARPSATATQEKRALEQQSCEVLVELLFWDYIDSIRNILVN